MPRIGKENTNTTEIVTKTVTTAWHVKSATKHSILHIKLKRGYQTAQTIHPVNQSQLVVIQGPVMVIMKNWLNATTIQNPHMDVDLLIGTNVSKLMEPWEVVKSQKEGPNAIKTLLGWVITGSAGQSKISYPVRVRVYSSC